MFAEGGGALAGRDPGSGHSKWQVHDLECAAIILHLGKRAAMSELRIAQGFGNGAIGRAGNAVGVQLGDAFFGVIVRDQVSTPSINSVQ